jgi:hypothetical protein
MGHRSGQGCEELSCAVGECGCDTRLHDAIHAGQKGKEMAELRGSPLCRDRRGEVNKRDRMDGIPDSIAGLLGVTRVTFCDRCSQ